MFFKSFPPKAGLFGGIFYFFNNEIMKLGYMSGFRGDLLTEIKFAKQYFDFTEITIQPEVLKTIDDIFYDLKNATANFKILGHIHWNIINHDEIVKNIKVLKDLGAKKITIHPFQDLDIEENSKILNEINIVLQKNDMQLLIENVSSAPYNSAGNILKLLEKIPDANITLDVGHANRISELNKFIDIFSGKIGHIHLHDNIGDSDHLFYDSQVKVDGIFSKLNSTGYDGTMLLETFSIMKDGKNTSQEFEEIKELHIEQLKKIKKHPQTIRFAIRQNKTFKKQNFLVQKQDLVRQKRR